MGRFKTLVYLHITPTINPIIPTLPQLTNSSSQLPSPTQSSPHSSSPPPGFPPISPTVTQPDITTTASSSHSSPHDISHNLHIPVSIPSITHTDNLPMSTHPMLTRAKSGISKPKLLVGEITHTNDMFYEPFTVQQALKSPLWRKAMEI